MVAAYADSMRILIVGSIALAACGLSVTTAAINAPPHPMYARPVETVEILGSGPPSRPHVDVMLIHAGVGDRKLPLTDMVDALRTKAAMAGCDALVVMSAAGRGNVDGLLATCVAYTDAPPSMAGR